MVVCDRVHCVFHTLPIPVYKSVHHDFKLCEHIARCQYEPSNDTVTGVVDPISAPKLPGFEWVQVIGVMVDINIGDDAMMWARIEANPAEKIGSDLRFEIYKRT